MIYLTYADLLRPATRKHQLFYDGILIIGGSLFIALTAQIAIYLPFSHVPITAQTLAILLCGALLGSNRGSASVFLYLWEGAIGLPVLAGGHGGISYLIGPTGGYLIGFIVAAYLVGFLSERGWDRHFHTTLTAMLLGSSLIYLCGLAWLVTFTGIDKVLLIGFYPFLPGDVVKLLIATLLLPSGWKILAWLKLDHANDD